jgi:hypothetical protein
LLWQYHVKCYMLISFEWSGFYLTQPCVSSTSSLTEASTIHFNYNAFLHHFWVQTASTCLHSLTIDVSYINISHLEVTQPLLRARLPNNV